MHLLGFNVGGISRLLLIGKCGSDKLQPGWPSDHASEPAKVSLLSWDLLIWTTWFGCLFFKIMYSWIGWCPLDYNSLNNVIAKFVCKWLCFIWYPSTDFHRHSNWGFCILPSVCLDWNRHYTFIYTSLDFSSPFFVSDSGEDFLGGHFKGSKLFSTSSSSSKYSVGSYTPTFIHLVH